MKGNWMKTALKIIGLVYTVLICAFIILSASQAALSATLVVDQKHSRASDTNPGSDKAPFRTISAAAKVVRPGDTILVKNGTYREQVNLPDGEKNARITFKAYPGHRPVVKGSEIVTGVWKKAHVALNPRPELKESIKISNGGTPALLQDFYDYLAQKDKQPQPSEQDNEVFSEDPDVPFTGIYVTDFKPYTQMVFIDEQPLKQIGSFKYLGPRNWPGGLVKAEGKSPKDMRPGTFCYDEKAQKLYVWLEDSGSPAKHRVEAAVRTCALKFFGYTTVSGIDMKQCQMDPDGPDVSGSALWAKGPEIIIENCRVMHSDFAGISMLSDDAIIRRCEIAYNGSVGYTASNCHRNLFINNEVHHNNTRMFNGGWHSAGVKVTHYFDSKFIGNYFHDEPGNSLWLDISCNNALVADNRFEDCGSLYFEISRWGVIVNNVLKNVNRGIWSYSSDVMIANNVIDSCGEGITVTGAIRPATYSIGTEPHKECLAAVRNNLIVNNIIIDSVGSFIGIWPDSEHCGNNFSDYNVFVWTLPVWHWGENHIKFMGSWDQYYHRPSYWQGKTGFDKHSTIVDPAILKAYKKNLAGFGNFDSSTILSDAGIVDRENGDYRLRPDSPLRGKGVKVPMLLDSLYYPGVRAWEKTLLEDAPDQASAKLLFEDGPYKHYRAQPNPEPMFMFDPHSQLKGDPGLNEEWKKTGKYPTLKKSGK